MTIEEPGVPQESIDMDREAGSHPNIKLFLTTRKPPRKYVGVFEEAPKQQSPFSVNFQLN